MMMNNPVMMLLNAARNGGNPMQLMQQMAMQDPRIAQAQQMMQGKSPQQLRQMAENMARERGTDLQSVARSLGIRI